jgi:thiamine kinase-like enzyme
LYDVWVGDHHWIAKEFLKPDEFETAPHHEFEALKLVSSLDIAPQPIYFQPQTASLPPVVIYEYIEGEMWDRHVPTAYELVQLAELWLKMHQVTRDDLWLSRGFERPVTEVSARFQVYFEGYANWAKENFLKGLDAVSTCLDLLHKHQPVIQEIEASKPVLCFCRADPRFANVIARPDGRIAFIDWEDSGLRDPARDLADLMCHANQEDLVTDDQWQPFLNAYLTERSKVDPAIAHRMQLYLAIFPLFWLAFLMNWGVKLAQSDQLSGWRVNELPANERLQRFLARSLAWPDWDISQQLNDVKDIQFFPAQTSID